MVNAPSTATVPASSGEVHLSSADCIKLEEDYGAHK